MSYTIANDTRHIILYGTETRVVPMQSGVTPLMKATVAGHIEVVEILIDAGANVDLKDMVRNLLGELTNLMITVRGISILLPSM